MKNIIEVKNTVKNIGFATEAYRSRVRTVNNRLRGVTVPYGFKNESSLRYVLVRLQLQVQYSTARFDNGTVQMRYGYTLGTVAELSTLRYSRQVNIFRVDIHFR